MSVSKYKTTAICPVCGATLDVVEHDEPKLLGMAATMLFGDGRRIHAAASSECKKHERWSRGWDTTTVEVPT